MSEFEVKVLGVKPPKKPDGKLKRLFKRSGKLLKAMLMRPRVLVTAGLTGAVLLIGTPHVGGAYECNHPMRGPGTCRSVAWCAYYGIQGRRIEVPVYGQSCALITILPFEFGKLIGG